MSEQHTSEPWVLYNGYGPLKDGLMHCLRIGPDFGQDGGISTDPDSADLKGTRADFERLVACVNALAGVGDPTAFIRDVRELVDTMARTKAGDRSGLWHLAGLRDKVAAHLAPAEKEARSA